MNYYEELNPLISISDVYIKNTFYALAPLYKEENGKEQDVPIQLFTSLHSTSESALILLQNGAIHDADVLLRTLMEGTIKYCYLMTGTREERHKKYIEYKISLSQIDRMSDHQKALEAISILKEFSFNSTKPFEAMLLSEEELNELKTIYPRGIRNELKQKWSYQNLLRSMAKIGVEYKAQLGTLSTYALTSHLIHYDWTGLSIRQAQIMDLDSENTQRLDIAQAIRILDNILAMYLFRVIEYMRGYNFRSDEVSEWIGRLEYFINQLTERENEIIETLD